MKTAAAGVFEHADRQNTTDTSSAVFPGRSRQRAETLCPNYFRGVAARLRA